MRWLPLVAYSCKEITLTLRQRPRAHAASHGIPVANESAVLHADAGAHFWCGPAAKYKE